jgi:Methyltransferase domain
MDHEKHFTEIAEFLKPYQKICQNEIMLMYPDPLQGYPLEWVEELAAIRDKNLIIQVEKKEVKGILHNPEFLEYYASIEELCQLPGLPDMDPLPESTTAFLYMTPKKQHEIKKLGPFLDQFYRKQGLTGLVDIGGGIGLLAQTMSNLYQHQVISLDMDPVLQETGRTRYDDSSVRYEQVKVHAQEKAFLDLLEKEKMTVGLHTCGPLAVDQLKGSVSSKIKGMINFGCCYNKMAKVIGSQNISQFAQQSENKFEQNLYSLTLSSRAHRKMDEKDFDLKLKVKLYRYAMHFLLHDEYGHKSIVTLGNTNPKMYDESFGTYALEQFKRIKIESKHSRDELDLYFADQSRQDLIWKMLAAGMFT